MKRLDILKAAVLGGVCASALATAACADEFNIPGGDLKGALNTYAKQVGIALIYADDEIRNTRTRGAHGDLTAADALSHILAGTGFATLREASAVAIVRADAAKPARAQKRLEAYAPLRVAAASASSVETVVVTSSKIKGDIQTVPIAITALSQEQLTSRQIAGGPDLVKEVPNLTFSKTNFTGYNIEIRGIGTQAISVATDPAVAVAFNDMPFIRNHFFEQEFYDVSQVEVLRGPQGTLYGRNATAGVVNVISAKPTDQFEAMLSADWGNFHNRRYEGMVNIPIVDDRLDLRIAGEWTKRDGYSFNELTNAPIDGRDLWSSRLTIGWKPVNRLQVYAVWEHFQENDDRIRSSKQLCKRDPGLSEVLGQTTYSGAGYLSQGCLPTSLYGPDAFQVVNGFSLPYFGGITGYGIFGALTGQLVSNVDPYTSVTQSRNLRHIQSALNPAYRAKNDVIEVNADYALTPSLTFTSQTGFNHDFLWSTEDFNRFNTAPGIFKVNPENTLVVPDSNNWVCAGGGISIGGTQDCAHPSSSGNFQTGYFCDPQLGCSNRLVAEDLSTEYAWQLNQEFRLSSNFKGPLNFSIGGNYLHYETDEKYYVFFNTITFVNAGCIHDWVGGVSDNSEHLTNGHVFPDLVIPGDVTSCHGYIDPNPIGSLNDQGHNYFLSQNPYVLNSYAGFGEAYFDVTKSVKLTGGLRWTDDEKHFIDIPSEVLSNDYGYPSSGVVDQKWKKWTGRLAVNWTPRLSFTEQTLVYGSFAHGYKAGGANPPGAELPIASQLSSGSEDINNATRAQPVHPLTFKPEFINAYELGTKNTLLDGALTLNGDIFFYDYKGYQISRIVDRTAINDNFDATVKGTELEAMWEPIPGLRFNFAGGYEDTRVKSGQSSIDLMDRTAGNPNWVVLKPFPTRASNCIMPAYVMKYLYVEAGFQVSGSCGMAYLAHRDPLTFDTYAPYPGVSTNGTSIPDYPGFDPLAGTPDDPYTGQNIYDGVDYGPAPNNGEGFAKDLGGNELPNAPHFTTSLSADWTIPVSEDWAATAHGDFYWQSQSWARIFNDRPYDKIRGYSNVNFALILTSASGWQVMGYLKNIFDTTAITGDFLNSDDTGLTTNVFLTDPRLFGVRVTKNW